MNDLDTSHEFTDSDRDAATITSPNGTADDASARPRRRFDRGLFVASLVIACGIVLIVWGMTSALTGSDGIDRPEEIESLQPVENALQVLQQERIVVDLQTGYQARLEIDGVALSTTTIGQADVDPDVQATPGTQVDLPTTAVFDPGSNVLSFQPIEGSLVETLEPGMHEARVVFWRIEDGPDEARSYRWQFQVI